MTDVLRGATAGLAGTAAMSAAMGLAKATGMMAGELPPRKVARNAEDALGVRDELSRPAFEASWVAQHFAYGAAAGVVYDLVRRRFGPDSGRPVLAGSLYGVAVWALSYAGWLPAAGLHPGPTREPRRRVAAEVASHLVYGVTTALVHEATRPVTERRNTD